MAGFMGYGFPASNTLALQIGESYFFTNSGILIVVPYGT